MITFKEYLAEVILGKVGSFASKSDFKPEKDKPDWKTTKTSNVGDYEVKETHNVHFPEMQHVKVYHKGTHIASIHGTRDGNNLHVEKTELAKSHQGIGLMPHVYAHLANTHKITVHSDSKQSVGGHSIWKKLSKRSDVKVVGNKAGKEVPAEFDKSIEDHHYVLRAVGHNTNPTLKENVEVASSDEVHKDKVKDYMHKNSLNHYTIDSERINNALHQNLDGAGFGSRKPLVKKRDLYSTVRNIDAVFADKKHHVGKDHVVYTGIRESPTRVLNKELKRSGTVVNGFHAHLPAYTSTSTDKEVAKRFSDASNSCEEENDAKHDRIRHVLKIHVPAGHPSLSVKGSSTKPRENEVLLHRGTRLHIHHEPTVDGHYRIWHARVIGHHLDDTE